MPIQLAHTLARRLAEVRKARRRALPAPRRQDAGHGPLRERQADRDREDPDLDAAQARRRQRDADQAGPVGARRRAGAARRLPRALHREEAARRTCSSTRPASSRSAARWATPASPGRKIIVDTYGGAARHGGGAFSGKDPSKVDRSAAYAARYVAKNVVAAGLADRCEVQVAYAIGVAHPLSLMVETYGTERVAAVEDRRAGRQALRPAPRRDHPRPRPAPADLPKTAAYGHFGRDDHDFTWEKTDKAEALRDDAGLERGGGET